MPNKIPWNKNIHSEKTRQIVLKGWETRRKNGHFLFDNHFIYAGKFRPHAGYYEDIGESFRSLWEANFARILSDGGYIWCYEKYHIILSDGHTYTPDFYIFNPETNFEAFVEIHPTNFIDEKFIYKLKMAENEINLIDNFDELEVSSKPKLLVIDTEKYLKLRDSFKNKIKNWDKIYATTSH